MLAYIPNPMIKGSPSAILRFRSFCDYRWQVDANEFIPCLTPSCFLNKQ